MCWLGLACPHWSRLHSASWLTWHLLNTGASHITVPTPFQLLPECPLVVWNTVALYASMALGEARGETDPSLCPLFLFFSLFFCFSLFVYSSLYYFSLSETSPPLWRVHESSGAFKGKRLLPRGVWEADDKTVMVPALRECDKAGQVCPSPAKFCHHKIRECDKANQAYSYPSLTDICHHWIVNVHWGRIVSWGLCWQTGEWVGMIFGSLPGGDDL